MRQRIRIPELVYLVCAAVAVGAGPAAATAAQPQVATSASQDARATGPIDWGNVAHGSPIPHQLPVADADTALAAGFSPQWIQKSVTNWPPSIADPDLPAKQILAIAKADRRPGDRWAHEMADKLRATLRANGDADVLRYARVFCGSKGCLCYFEVPSGPSSFKSYEGARSALIHGLIDSGGWGQPYGIKQEDLGEVGETDAWELLYVMRNKSNGG